MTATPAEQGDERRFGPTSGTAMGWVGMGVAALGIAAVFYDSRTVEGARFGFGAAMFGVLVWCFLLRPRVVLRRREVELRNAFSSWHVPLASVRRVAVRAITRLHTDDGHYDGIAVGRPLRVLTRRQAATPRAGLPGLSHGAPLPVAPEPPKSRTVLDASGMADFVTERILEGADEARASGDTPGTPRRSWARVELALLAVFAAGLVVTLLL